MEKSARKATESVAKTLRAEGFPATHYHAGRTKLTRERAHASFAAGRSRVLVATNAFGMGIDFPDIRLIVHFQAPGSDVERLCRNALVASTTEMALALQRNIIAEDIFKGLKV